MTRQSNSFAVEPVNSNHRWALLVPVVLIISDVSLTANLAPNEP